MNRLAGEILFRLSVAVVSVAMESCDLLDRAKSTIRLQIDGSAQSQRNH